MQEEINRLISYLKETDPRAPEYSLLTSNLRNLLEIKNSFGLDYEPKIIEASLETKATIDEIKFEAVVTDDVIIEEPKQITFEDVREAFKDAATSGIIIRPIITKYIPEGAANNLASVPKEMYPQLLEDLRNAR